MVWNCSIDVVTLLFSVSGKSKTFGNESKTIGEKFVIQRKKISR